jgi:hypothetical protein
VEELPSNGNGGARLNGFPFIKNRERENMYNVIIVRGFAHRILNNGMMESAKVATVNDLDDVGYIFEESDFQVRDPKTMNLTGGDYVKIQSDLQLYSHIMPADYILPSQGEVSYPEFKGDKPA